MFSYDFRKIRNLPKIFLRSFENVSHTSLSLSNTLHCDKLNKCTSPSITLTIVDKGERTE